MAALVEHCVFTSLLIRLIETIVCMRQSTKFHRRASDSTVDVQRRAFFVCHIYCDGVLVTKFPPSSSTRTVKRLSLS